MKTQATKITDSAECWWISCCGFKKPPLCNNTTYSKTFHKLFLTGCNCAIHSTFEFSELFKQLMAKCWILNTCANGTENTEIQRLRGVDQ